MSATTTIRIDRMLYDQAKVDAAGEHRTIAGQVEFWARIGRAALDNPDLPVTFVTESLADWLTLRQWGYAALGTSGTGLSRAGVGALRERRRQPGDVGMAAALDHLPHGLIAKRQQPVIAEEANQRDRRERSNRVQRGRPDGRGHRQ